MKIWRSLIAFVATLLVGSATLAPAAASLLNVSGGSTSAAVQIAEQASSWWPNYPIMSVGMAQGPVADNLLDSSTWDEIADYDVWAFQWSYPTTSRNTLRVTGMDGVHALQAGTGARTRFMVYINLNQTLKDTGSSQNDPLEVVRDYVASPTEGNSNWYLKRGSPNQASILEPNFSPAANRQANMARGAGVNSLGETHFQVFFRKWDALLGTGVPATNVLSRLSGFFFDNFNQRVPKVWTSTTTAVTDYDMNGDGTADSRADYSATGGSGRWARGHLDAMAAMQATSPDFVGMVNSAEWDGDYIGNAVDPPPLPFSAAPFYQKFEMPMAESRHLNLGFLTPQTNYNITGGSLSRTYRGIEIQKQMLLPDANTVSGHAAVVMHTNVVDHTTLTQDDYEYARLFTGMSLLIDHCATSVTSGASRPVPLDERLLYLGDPSEARTMGTINTSTAGFTPRAARFTSGAGQFWWAEFDEAVVILRGDYPVGAWPNADAAVSFPLSTQVPAGTGFKWQNPNGATYVNPRTGRAMRNVSPTITNGADVTAISMKPLTVRFVRRVAADLLAEPGIRHFDEVWEAANDDRLRLVA